MKKVWTGILTVALAAWMSIPAFAGSWKHDVSRPANENGVSNWWYQNDDGSYPAGYWVWIDGNQDGLAESYRFNENGWLYVSTKVDGYDVDASGAWIANGEVMRRNMEVWTNPSDTNSDSAASDSFANTSDSQEKNGWRQDADGRQYLNTKGVPVTGFKKISGKRYCFGEDGYMLTGYQEVDGQEYYFFADGEQATKTVHSSEDGVYYVIDKTEYYIVDIVDEDDWKEYKKEADRESVDVSKVVNEKNEVSKTDESGSSLTDDEAYKKITALKKNWPEGKKWDNSNSYRSVNRIGYGCAGFAFMVQDEVFGKDAARTRHDELEWDELRVGDHLRIYNNIGGEHSVIVLKVEDDSVTICEGNYNASIHWGREMTMDYLEGVFIYRETYYD
ncbi:MAG: hypothetical protein HFE84_08930 [Lachnospiraceae bacterium]|nr:hypothetical protein [Lachnospiraceae bacterium]